MLSNARTDISPPPTVRRLGQAQEGARYRGWLPLRPLGELQCCVTLTAWHLPPVHARGRLGKP